MACMKCGICLLILALAQASALHCLRSERLPWIPPHGFHVYSPWSEYPLSDRRCCRRINPMVEFNAQERCSLCYNQTKSTPGFAADPNNCQKFYMCEPAGGTDKWNVFPMMCPNCTFWNQEKLTCVEVYSDPDNTGVCGHFEPVTDVAPVATHEVERKLFCIDFENEHHLADNGVYVYNDGVTVVSDPSCPEGSRCGLFNGGRLEIPFFSNNYESMTSLGITFLFKYQGGSSEQGNAFISNDCYPDATVPYAAGNSLYCSIKDDVVSSGLKARDAGIADADISASAAGASSWVYVEIKWDGEELWMALRKDGPDGQLLDAPKPAAFKSFIRNSHCPLVIGSYIKEAVDSYFNGYMDNICFYRW